LTQLDLTPFLPDNPQITYLVHKTTVSSATPLPYIFLELCRTMLMIQGKENFRVYKVVNNVVKMHINLLTSGLNISLSVAYIMKQNIKCK